MTCTAAADTTRQFSHVLLVTIHLVQTYVTNLNAQKDKFPELKDLGLVTLNQSVGSSKIPKEAATAVRYLGVASCGLHGRIDAYAGRLQEQWRRTLESLVFLEGTAFTSVFHDVHNSIPSVNKELTAGNG